MPESKQDPPIIVKDQAAFHALFQRTGYRFRYFDLELKSGGTDVDIDFNYKDLAHLEVVHSTFKVFPSYIAADFYSAIFLQKIFGLTIAVTNHSMQIKKNHLFVHNSIFNIILTSEVITEPLPNYEVMVRTRYGIGAPRYFLPLIFPLLKWTLVRNYNRLMDDDVPMRNRRGEVRRWGVRLPKTSYGFCETLDIMQQHAFAGEAPPPQPADIPLASVTPASPQFYGRSDHFGLQIFRRDDLIEVYPRMCPHEGACLDTTDLKARGALRCGWHGRLFRPILRVAASQPDGIYASQFHRFVLAGGTLRIEPIPYRDAGEHQDWTASASAAP